MSYAHKSSKGSTANSEPRRVVVLTLETFQRLRDKSAQPPAQHLLTQDDCSSESNGPSNLPSNASGEEDSAPANPSSEPLTGTEIVEESTPAILPVSNPEPREIVVCRRPQSTPSTNESVSSNPVSDRDGPFALIPDRYRRLATLFLGELGRLEDIDWRKDPASALPSGSAEITINGVGQGITIQQFLKAVCVPFTPPLLTADCHHFLNRHNIKPRNHLIKSPNQPPWHPYFRF